MKLSIRRGRSPLRKAPLQPLAAPLLVSIVFLAAFALLRCANEDVGVPCALPGTGTAPGTGTGGQLRPVVVTNALDCLSRLCARPATSEQSAKALCTKTCSSDDDCPGPSDSCTTPGGQAMRYVCKEVTETGSLKCCKMCVCSAYTSGSSELSVTCTGYKATCPNL